MSRSIRLLALVPYPLGRAPGQRYRIEQWAPHLKSRGIDITFAPFLDASAHDALYDSGNSSQKVVGVLRGVLRNTRRAIRVFDADAVFVFREASLIGPALLERTAALVKPLVFDFDDAIWLPQEGSANPRWTWLRSAKKAGFLCRAASAVTVGNAFLADWARKLSGNVTILPSTIDPGVYGDAKHHTPQARTVGWMGSHSTVKYLEDIVPFLVNAARKRPFRLLVVGATIPPREGMEIECRPWSAEREAADLREMDLGLMPLPDNEWTRGKCAMKAIQYLSVGVPAIASPVGANVDVVLDGKTGILASSAENWERAVISLLDDVSARQRLGGAGRELVLADYSAARQARRLGDLLHSLVGPKA